MGMDTHLREYILRISNFLFAEKTSEHGLQQPEHG
jgi:hypothetical protein